MMRLRQAKKLMGFYEFREQAEFEPTGRDRRALRRYLRWRHRPRSGSLLTSFLHYYVLDRAGRARRFTGDRFDWDLKLAFDRRVAWSEGGKITVSTIFIGMDAFGSICGGPPLVFETVVNTGSGWEGQRRYPTKHDAIIGHTAVAASLGLEP